MKTNKELGYEEVTAIGNYNVAQNGARRYRAYGYEYFHDQSIALEGPHHEVCGRGETAKEAVNKMITAAIRAGEAGTESARGGRDHWVGHDGLTRSQALRLQEQLLEAVAEAVEA